MAPETTRVRTTAERVADTRVRLGRDVDAWVASASAQGGVPCLVPLSFLWVDEAFLLATLADGPTDRNLSDGGTARLALDGTRDVVLVDGEAETLPLAAVPDPAAEAFAAHTGFDPRAEPEAYAWIRVRPRWVRAWRDVPELQGRVVMRDGVWLTAD